MRPDFGKLLTESERYGSNNPSQKWGKRLKYNPDSDYEDEPTRASMSRHQRNNGKELSDVLSPLEGYLRKNKGRHWDDIYSELCQNLDRRSVSGLHVFQHIWDFVAKNCWIGAETGTVYENGYGFEVNGFYVHPFTGILCEQIVPSYRVRRKKELAERPVTVIRISNLAWYEQIKGIWYYLESYDIPHERLTTVPPWNPDKNLIQVKGEPDQWLVKWVEHVNTKRQLNKKELKKLGLKNAVRNPQPLSRRKRKTFTVKAN